MDYESGKWIELPLGSCPVACFVTGSVVPSTSAAPLVHQIFIEIFKNVFNRQNAGKRGIS